MTATRYPALLITAVLASACWNSRIDIVSNGDVVATRAEAQTGGTLPAGADMYVRLDQSLTLGETKAGDNFSMTVRRPLMALNGDVVIPEGARIHGKVRGMNEAADGARAKLNIEVEAIEFNGKRFPLEAYVLEVADVKDTNALLAGTKMLLRVSEAVLLR